MPLPPHAAPAVVAHVIDTTYQEADATLIGSMLGGLEGAELEAFAKHRGWEVRDGGKKFFVAQQEELVQSKNIIETINFQSTSRRRAAAAPCTLFHACSPPSAYCSLRIRHDFN